MRKLSQTQQKTLELLEGFKNNRLTEEILKLFPQRDILSFQKRGLIKYSPYEKVYFLCEKGFKICSQARIKQSQNGASDSTLKALCESRLLLNSLIEKLSFMSRVTVRCPQCGKVATVVKAVPAFKNIFKTYSCGHMIVEKEIQLPEGRDEIWPKLRPYQQEGVIHLEKSNFQDLLGDAPGLGKTVQVLTALRYHFDELTPTLCVVKSSLKYQWAAHYIDWTLKDPNELHLMPYIITDGAMPVLSGFKFYILGMDLLKKKWEDLSKLGIKLIIVDESHHFKNGDTARTGALSKLIQESNIPHRIFTSGTPILNRASEFFTTLNLIRPDEWASKAGFQRQWLDTEITETGATKYTGILPYMKERFHEKISPYFLRREKREVLKDLPPFQRNFRIVDVEDVNLKRMYNNELDLMRNWMKNNEITEKQESRFTLLSYLNKLRQITGAAKVPACVEDTLDFLEYADAETGDKIAIGAHHKVVISSLKLAFEIRGFNVITITGDDSPEAKFNKEQQFRDNKNHILLASTLACGEGINLQFCSMATLLERQWNAAKEEQFESRFDRFGQQRPTSCDYFIAKGTVDEFFSKMVEKKREICIDTLGDEMNVETNIDLLKELADETVRNRL